MKSRTFISEQIILHAEKSADQLVFIHNKVQITFSQLNVIIADMSVVFKKQQLNENTPVLVNLPMGIDLAILIAALLYNGIPALVLPPGMKVHEVKSVADEFPFVSLITNELMGEKLAVEQSKKYFLDYSDLFITSIRRLENSAVGFAWLLYTSGSTGKPKIVMLSPENIVSRTTGEIDLFGIKNNNRILNLLPFAHDLGLNQLLTSLCSGSSLEILVNILPIEMMKKISAGEFNGVTGMPLIWNNFIELVEKSGEKINYSGYLTVSGGSMTEQQLLKLKEIFKNARIFKTYGQTETFRTFAETRQEAIHLNQCGEILKNVEIQLIDDEGKICEAGETGQLVHFGQGLMSGYWLDKELTHSKLKDGGVLTGDYFKILPGPEYQYAGRKDDLIKHAGRRFFLSEVEECLNRTEFVSEACVAVIDNLRTILGSDKLVAFILAKNTTEELSTKLRLHCATQLENFKVPAEFIICNDFPRTPSNKIDKKELIKNHGYNNG